MCNEIEIKTGRAEYKVFLQNGFSPDTNPVMRIHKHNYAEMHLFLGGEAVVSVENKSIVAKDGDIILIPRRIPHYVTKIGDNVSHTAFQISCELSEVMIRSVSNGLVSEFFAEISKSEKVLNFSTISAYIALFISKFPLESPIEAIKINDYGFLIHEFFSQRYGDDVKLSDLADVLHLSARQTERLVTEYTGHGFGKELTATRMAMAAHLINSSSLPLDKIAEYVGYRSYVGFWKAFKKTQNKASE